MRLMVGCLAAVISLTLLESVWGQTTNRSRTGSGMAQVGSGLQFPSIGSNQEPRTQPTSPFVDLLEQPISNDPFAGLRADPRTAQQGQTASGTVGRGGQLGAGLGMGMYGLPGSGLMGAYTGFGLGGRLPAGATMFGRGGLGSAFGRSAGMGRNSSMANRPSFAVRMAPLSAGLAPPPSIATLGAVTPPKLVPPVTAALQRIEGIDSIEVEMAGSTAILKGVVDSPETKRLAEMIMRLEPDVKDVRNELRIASAEASEVPPSSSPDR
jgi:hypothetical protein